MFKNVVQVLGMAWMVAGVCGSVWAADAPDYWPTNGWRMSTAEAQGMDSAQLAKMLEWIQQEALGIRSVMVIRNGYVVTQADIAPYTSEWPHRVHSCTKSILSTLIGMAVDDGAIESVERPMLAFFPDKTVQQRDGRKEAVTLRHLLSMSSGLATHDSYLFNWQGLREMRASADWTQYMLDRPVEYEPGTHFDYSNGTSYLLAAILQRSVGTTALEFANQRLFAPLGIREVVWPESPQGINIGWGQMMLTPPDLAKIGSLYLHKGQWDGQQLLSPEWVEAATRKVIDAGTLAEGYGYQWWISEDGFPMMLGYGGQYCIVAPEHNLVVVFISALKNSQFFVPKTLFKNFILPAISSSDALPENPDAQAQLEAITEALRQPPKPETAGFGPVLQEMALRVSGKTYAFQPNSFDFKTLSLRFAPLKSTAQFQFTYRDYNIDAEVGLDGVYRLTQVADELYAYRGRWEDARTFVLDYQIMNLAERGSFRLQFSDDSALVRFQEDASGTRRTIRAMLQP